MHAFRHPKTPKWIKGFMLAVLAYLLSPVDMIPDFALILGLTDDVVVVTMAMWFLGQMIPSAVQDEFEAKNNLDVPVNHTRNTSESVASESNKAKRIDLNRLSLAIVALTLIGFVFYQTGGWEWAQGVMKSTTN